MFDHVYGAVPAVAARVTEYATDGVTSGRLDVVIIGGAGEAIVQ
jgi:hypothetical protein